MGGLFSVFDPSVMREGVRANWLSCLVILLFIPRNYWALERRWSERVGWVLTIVKGELRVGFGFGRRGGLVGRVVGLFLIIVLNNVAGLLPYCFTASRHLVYTLRLALPLWLGHVVYSWVKQAGVIWAHMVPLGTPGPLIMFIVLVEILRRTIRPVTLSVRLAANIVAGHLLLVLLRGRMGGRMT